MRREPFDKMNVVPFIDIVLVLLVIVLATATFVTNQTIKVDLPTASSQKNEEKKSITIAINKEGEYFYNKEALPFEEIKEMTGFEIPYVRVILSRSRQKIKSELEKIYDYGQNRKFTKQIL